MIWIRSLRIFAVLALAAACTGAAAGAYYAAGYEMTLVGITIGPLLSVATVAVGTLAGTLLLALSGIGANVAHIRRQLDMQHDSHEMADAVHSRGGLPVAPSPGRQYQLLQERSADGPYETVLEALKRRGAGAGAGANEA